MGKEMENCGLTIPNEVELAIIFAEGLKQGSRPRKYMDDLKSKCAHCPEDYPKSIAEVWRIVTSVNIQEHKSVANNDHHKREADVTHNQPRVRDNRSNSNELDRGRNRPPQRSEQASKTNEGQITNAAPAKRVFALTGRVNEDDTEAEDDDDDYSEQLQDEIKQYLNTNPHEEAQVMLTMIPPDSNCHEHIIPDFQEHQYAGTECLEIKQSTHAYFEDEGSKEPKKKGLFATATIQKDTPIIKLLSRSIRCKARNRYLTKEDANAQVIRVQDGEEIRCVIYAISDINVGEEILWNHLLAPESDEPANKRAKASEVKIISQDNSDSYSEHDDPDSDPERDDSDSDPERDDFHPMSDTYRPVYNEGWLAKQKMLNQDDSDSDPERDDFHPMSDTYRPVYNEGWMAKQKMLAEQVDVNTAKKAELYLTEISSRNKDSNNYTSSLDSQAVISISKNKNLFNHIETLDRPIKLMGMPGRHVSVYTLRSSDDDIPPEVKHDSNKHEHVSRHQLRVKESTRVHVDDDLKPNHMHGKDIFGTNLRRKPKRT